MKKFLFLGIFELLFFCVLQLASTKTPFLLIVLKVVFFLWIISIWTFQRWLSAGLLFSLVAFYFSFQVNFFFNVYSLLSGLCIILALVATPSAQLAGSRSRRRLHDQLVKSVMCNSLHFFQTIPHGRIINRFSYDMSIIDKVRLNQISHSPFYHTNKNYDANKTHQSTICYIANLYSNVNLSFQKIATTSQRLLQFILLCSCAILINGFINKCFILLTVPILVIYYFVQKFYRESTR